LYTKEEEEEDQEVVVVAVVIVIICGVEIDDGYGGHAVDPSQLASPPRTSRATGARGGASVGPIDLEPIRGRRNAGDPRRFNP